MDRLGMAQHFSRLGLLQDGNTGASLAQARQHFTTHSAWQGLRREIENLFVCRDPIEVLVAQAMVADALVYGLCVRRFEAVWAGQHGDALATLLDFPQRYQYRHAAGFPVWLPSAEEMEWLSAKYPDTFDTYYRPRYEQSARMAADGKPFANGTLPRLCQVCQWPMLFTEADDPTALDFNPHVAALRCMGITPGVDGGDLEGHVDAVNWVQWTGRPASMHDTKPPAAPAPRRDAA